MVREGDAANRATDSAGSGARVDESAEVLGVSPDTIMRDWKMAKAWLLRELSEP